MVGNLCGWSSVGDKFRKDVEKNKDVPFLQSCVWGRGWFLNEAGWGFVRQLIPFMMCWVDLWGSQIGDWGSTVKEAGGWEFKALKQWWGVIISCAKLVHCISALHCLLVFIFHPSFSPVLIFSYRLPFQSTSWSGWQAQWRRGLRISDRGLSA